MTPSSITRCVVPLMLGAVQAAVAAPLHEASLSPDAAVPLAQLKRQYLACDAAASQRLMGSGEAAVCSVVSERLLREGFGGDFDALLSWWREAKSAFSAARGRPGPPS
jgi:hypothetical protein